MADNAISLDLEPRDITGKAVKRLRREGKVPAVIHDHGKESVLVQAAYMDVQRVYHKAGKHHPVHLSAGNRTFTALIKDAAFEPKKNQLSHVVFNAVNRNQKVEADVPVRPHYAEGTEASPAERAGLIVLEQLTNVAIRAIPDRLPDALEYDAEKLAAEGDQLTVADLVLPDGVELADPELLEHPIATVVTPASLEAANAAAGGTATVEDAENVAAEHESGTEEGTQAGEIRPGGKEEKPDSNLAKNPEKK